jgi:hypothetical protein
MVACIAAAAVSCAHAMPVHIEVVLQPGKAHEECFTLQPGQRVQYHFKLDRPGEFNLHYHRGKEVFYPRRSEAVLEQKGDYVAAAAEKYCLMWSGSPKGATKLGYEFIVVEPGLTKQ